MMERAAAAARKTSLPSTTAAGSRSTKQKPASYKKYQQRLYLENPSTSNSVSATSAERDGAYTSVSLDSTVGSSTNVAERSGKKTLQTTPNTSTQHGDSRRSSLQASPIPSKVGGGTEAARGKQGKSTRANTRSTSAKVNSNPRAADKAGLSRDANPHSAAAADPALASRTEDNRGFLNPEDLRDVSSSSTISDAETNTNKRETPADDDDMAGERCGCSTLTPAERDAVSAVYATHSPQGMKTVEHLVRLFRALYWCAESKASDAASALTQSSPAAEDLLRTAELSLGATRYAEVMNTAKGQASGEAGTKRRASCLSLEEALAFVGALKRDLSSQILDGRDDADAPFAKTPPQQTPILPVTSSSPELQPGLQTPPGTTKASLTSLLTASKMPFLLPPSAAHPSTTATTAANASRPPPSSSTAAANAAAASKPPALTVGATTPLSVGSNGATATSSGTKHRHRKQTPPRHRRGPSRQRKLTSPPMALPLEGSIASSVGRRDTQSSSSALYRDAALRHYVERKAFAELVDGGRGAAHKRLVFERLAEALLLFELVLNPTAVMAVCHDVQLSEHGDLTGAKIDFETFTQIMEAGLRHPLSGEVRRPSPWKLSRNAKAATNATTASTIPGSTLSMSKNRDSEEGDAPMFRLALQQDTAASMRGAAASETISDDDDDINDATLLGGDTTTAPTSNSLPTPPPQHPTPPPPPPRAGAANGGDGSSGDPSRRDSNLSTKSIPAAVGQPQRSSNRSRSNSSFAGSVASQTRSCSTTDDAYPVVVGHDSATAALCREIRWRLRTAARRAAREATETTAAVAGPSTGGRDGRQRDGAPPMSAVSSTLTSPPSQMLCSASASLASSSSQSYYLQGSVDRLPTAQHGIGGGGGDNGGRRGRDQRHSSSSGASYRAATAKPLQNSSSSLLSPFSSKQPSAPHAAPAESSQRQPRKHTLRPSVLATVPTSEAFQQWQREMVPPPAAARWTSPHPYAPAMLNAAPPQQQQQQKQRRGSRGGGGVDVSAADARQTRASVQPSRRPSLPSGPGARRNGRRLSRLSNPTASQQPQRAFGGPPTSFSSSRPRARRPPKWQHVAALSPYYPTNPAHRNGSVHGTSGSGSTGGNSGVYAHLVGTASFGGRYARPQLGDVAQRLYPTPPCGSLSGASPAAAVVPVLAGAAEPGTVFAPPRQGGSQRHPRRPSSAPAVDVLSTDDNNDSNSSHNNHSTPITSSGMTQQGHALVYTNVAMSPSPPRGFAGQPRAPVRFYAPGLEAIEKRSTSDAPLQPQPQRQQLSAPTSTEALTTLVGPPTVRRAVPAPPYAITRAAAVATAAATTTTASPAVLPAPVHLPALPVEHRRREWLLAALGELYVEHRALTQRLAALSTVAAASSVGCSVPLPQEHQQQQQQPQPPQQQMSALAVASSLMSRQARQREAMECELALNEISRLIHHYLAELAVSDTPSSEYLALHGEEQRRAAEAEVRREEEHLAYAIAEACQAAVLATERAQGAADSSPTHASHSTTRPPRVPLPEFASVETTTPSTAALPVLQGSTASSFNRSVATETPSTNDEVQSDVKSNHDTGDRLPSRDTSNVRRSAGPMTASPLDSATFSGAADDTAQQSEDCAINSNYASSSRSRDSLQASTVRPGADSVHSRLSQHPPPPPVASVNETSTRTVPAESLTVPELHPAHRSPGPADEPALFVGLVDAAPSGEKANASSPAVSGDAAAHSTASTRGGAEGKVSTMSPGSSASDAHHSASAALSTGSVGNGGAPTATQASGAGFVTIFASSALAPPPLWSARASPYAASILRPRGSSSSTSATTTTTTTLTSVSSSAVVAAALGRHAALNTTPTGGASTSGNATAMGPSTAAAAIEAAGGLYNDDSPSPKANIYLEWAVTQLEQRQRRQQQQQQQQQHQRSIHSEHTAHNSITSSFSARVKSVLAPHASGTSAHNGPTHPPSSNTTTTATTMTTNSSWTMSRLFCTPNTIARPPIGANRSTASSGRVLMGSMNASKHGTDSGLASILTDRQSHLSHTPTALENDAMHSADHPFHSRSVEPATAEESPTLGYSVGDRTALLRRSLPPAAASRSHVGILGQLTNTSLASNSMSQMSGISAPLDFLGSTTWSSPAFSRGGIGGNNANGASGAGSSQALRSGHSSIFRLGRSSGRQFGGADNQRSFSTFERTVSSIIPAGFSGSMFPQRDADGKVIHEDDDQD